MTSQRLLALGLTVLLASAGTSCGTKSSDCTLTSWAQTTTGKEVPLNDGVKVFDSLAQSFKVTASDSAATASVVSVGLSLLRTGDFPLGTTLTATINADSTGSPSATALGTATVGMANVSTTASVATFVFPTALTLTTGTPYWIVLKGSYGNSSTTYVKWLGYSDAVNYPDGQAKEHIQSATSWSSSDYGDQEDQVFFVNKC